MDFISCSKIYSSLKEVFIESICIYDCLNEFYYWTCFLTNLSNKYSLLFSVLIYFKIYFELNLFIKTSITKKILRFLFSTTNE